MRLVTVQLDSVEPGRGGYISKVKAVIDEFIAIGRGGTALRERRVVDILDSGAKNHLVGATVNVENAGFTVLGSATGLEAL